MRLIKQILIGFIGISLIIFIISLFLPSHVRVSKSILLSVHKDSVANSLAKIQSWQSWNPLLQDKTMKYYFEGDNRVSWKAPDNKINAITLQRVSADSIIAVITTNDRQAFQSGFNVVENTDDTSLTKVDWWIMENLKWYPWEKFYGLFSESLKETYLENSLKSFKLYMEDKK
ncbi:MAG: hypothetical protein IT249_15985 [Chitinophagaceae bacterium]|nr:hypothetical protein [Chitinophagaceae bacterium]